MAPLAKKYEDKIIFGTVDLHVFDSIIDNLHLEPNMWPAFAIKDTAKGQRFPLGQGQQLSEGVISSLVNDFIAGNLKPSLKSEPVPAVQQGLVRVIHIRKQE
jgi:protein disulfide-isomerase A1